MKTRLLIIIGIVVVAVSLSYYVIYDSSTTVFVSCDPRYEQIDGKCVLLKPEQYCTDWCDLQELSNMGCNQPVLDYIFRYTNLFNENFDNAFYHNFVGLPDEVSEEQFEKCADFILEKRTKSLENTEPEPVFTGITLLNNNPEMVKRILDYCDSTGIKLSYGLRSSNGTHIITNSTCEWQTIEKYESDSNLENILDRCLHGNVGFTDEDFARWHNATHFIDTNNCEWQERK